MDLLANKNIPESYTRKAEEAINTKTKFLKNILYHKKIPEDGWNNKTIEDLFLELTTSSHQRVPNGNIKFACEIVSRRNYNISQGAIGLGFKSVEDKEEMSFTIVELANSFISELMKTMGIIKPFQCSIIPVATGMSLIFAMLTFRSLKPNSKYVIWSRIDQKSCLKSIVSAGFIPIIVDTKCVNGEYVTDINTIEMKIIVIGAEKINCILSTSSCFAPRACDDIEHIGMLCKKYNIYHLVNNAYGFSNRYIMKRINKASLNGGIDIFVQSTDKNLCVPVGGAVVASFSKHIFCRFSDICSEKMSVSAAIDVVLTLLSMGKKKYMQMVDDCETMYVYLKSEMSKLSNKYDEKIIDNPGNPISVALTLNNIPKALLTKIGAMLYTRNISGARVITIEEVKTVCDFKFEKWGTHSNECQVPYLTAAASIGVLKSDVEIFIQKLDKILSSLLHK